jgi:capsular exopolysaccharide synthesis family protein
VPLVASYLRWKHRPVADGQDVATRPVELGDYARILWRRKHWIVLAVVIGLVVAFETGGSRHKQYQASAEVLAGTPSNAVESSVMDTNIQILQSQAVSSIVLKKDPNAGSVTGRQDGDSASMVITAERSTPEAAVSDANAYAQAYVTYSVQQQQAGALAPVPSLQSQINALQTQINSLTTEINAVPLGSNQQFLQDRRNALFEEQLSLQQQVAQAEAQAASANLSPSVLSRAAGASEVGTSRAKVLALGVGAGLVVGLALAFLFEFLDDSIANVEEAELELGPDVPVLGTVPRLVGKRGSTISTLVGLREPGSAETESYRKIRTALHFLGRDAAGATLQFVSPTPGEGATTTAANLAVLLARAGLEVVLVDANLRRPRLEELFGCRSSVGLSSVIIGDSPLEAALQPVPTVESLSVLTAGPVPPNPAELVGSRRFAEVMSSLQTGRRCIVVDSAPLLSFSDGLFVASTVQAVVLVTSAKGSSRRRLRRAVLQLQKAEAPLVGVVLNRSGRVSDLPDWHRPGSSGRGGDEKSSDGQLARI